MSNSFFGNDALLVKNIKPWCKLQLLRPVHEIDMKKLRHFWVGIAAAAFGLS